MSDVIRILVVEDDPVQCAVYQILFETEGYEVHTAVSAKSGREQFLALDPDVVVLDRMLPDEDGIGLCGWMKRKVPAVYVLMLSGLRTAEVDRVLGLSSGADDYLLKPVGQQELLARVRVAVRTRRLQRALLESEQQYRLLAESATDIIGRLAPDGRILYLSPAARTLLGYDPEALLGIDVAEFVHPDDRGSLTDLSQRLQGSTADMAFACRFRRQDGSYAWLETNIRLVQLSKRAPDLVIVARDSTRRRALEAQMHLLSSALNAAASGLIITDREGIIQWANPAMTQLTGYATAELIGQSARIFGSGEQPAEFFQAFWQTITTGQVWQGELINRHKAGHLYPEEMRVTPVHDADGAISHFVAIKHDISERRAADLDRTRLATMVEQAAEVKVIVGIDGRIVYTNPYFSTFTNQAAAEVLGRPLAEAFTSAVNWSPETLLDAALTRGESWRGQVECRYAYVARYLDVQLFPIRAEDGRILNVGLVAQDVTSKVELQLEREAIVRTADVLRQQLTRGDMMPPLLDEIGQLLSADGIAIVQYDEAADEYVIEFARGVHAGMIGRRLQPEQSLTYQIPAGARHYVNNQVAESVPPAQREKLGPVRAVAAVPLLVKAHQLGVLWIGRQMPILETDMRMLLAVADIAASSLYRAELYERSQQHAVELARRVAERTAALTVANTQLSGALQARDEFLASMSHELRTPLSAILLRTELLRSLSYGELTAKQLQSVDAIHISAIHLVDLINDILDVAKIEAGKLTLDKSPVSVNELCQSACQVVMQLAADKQIALTFQPLADDLTLFADPRRLKQILLNLLSNAIKFTPRSGRVGLDVALDAGQEAVAFTVWDTGIGIAHDDIPRLFEPFVQLDSSLSRKYEGTGLGLTLVNHLVSLHDGGIRIESEPDRGTEITVMIPQSVQSEERMNGHTPFADSGVSDMPIWQDARVLLAEDNQSTVEALLDYFSGLGLQTAVAQNGLEVLEKLPEVRPNLILMDIHMPDMDGLEAIRRIKQNGFVRKSPPIIALTALAMPGDRERCLDAGADEYLSKPFSLATLTKLMARYLSMQ